MYKYLSHLIVSASDYMKTLTSLVVLILLLIGVWYVVDRISARTPQVQTPAAPILLNTVSYACGTDTSLIASYYEGSPTPATSADQPPVPDGSIQLAISDGRHLILPQIVSSTGARYALADGSFLFWKIKLYFTTR